MELEKIDLLNENTPFSKPDKKPFLFFRKMFIAFFILLVTTVVVFSFGVHTTSEKTQKKTKISLFSLIQNFVAPSQDSFEGEKDDRVNFLLTGIGGKGHEGPELTDTILFVSYRPSTKKIAFMSLPRDMTVSIPNKGSQKINHVNAYAEKEDPGSGAEVTAKFVGELLNQPVPYYFRVDFNGFAEFIDSIGGITVTVDQAFSDPAYPIIGKEFDTCGNSKESMNAKAADLLPPPSNSPSPRVEAGLGQGGGNDSDSAIPPPDYSCRFTALTFKKGTVHMDGETALAFVRSRHGTNGEGSDFARSKRQQKIILAVKDKVFSASTFLNPVRIANIFETLDKNISTNLSVSHIMRLGKEFRDLNSEEIVSHVVDDSPTSPLYATNLNGAYVLLPKNDDWTTLQQMTRYIFTPEPEKPVVQRTTKIPEPAKITPTTRIEIQNGTSVTGLGVRASQLLRSNKPIFEVIKVGNAVTKDYDHTVIFDLTNGKKPNELSSLKTFFQAEIASASGWMKNNEVVPKNVAVTPDDSTVLPTNTEIDFLVILGQSARDIVMK